MSETMTDERIDLSQLGPADNEALVRAIGRRTEAILAARRAQTTTIQLAAWWPSVAAAAVIVAIASALVLTLEPRPANRQMATMTPLTAGAGARTDLARALGVPAVLAVSLASETPPTAREFLRGLGGAR
jgi:hypothetical protein